MTKQEFLTQLQRDLNGSIGSKRAAGHIEYYQEYIEIELRKGRSQEEIMEELGSPGLIARSIEDAGRYAEKRESKNKRFLKCKNLVRSLCAGLCQGAFEKLQKWFDRLK